MQHQGYFNEFQMRLNQLLSDYELSQHQAAGRWNSLNCDVVIFISSFSHDDFLHVTVCKKKDKRFSQRLSFSRNYNVFN